MPEFNDRRSLAYLLPHDKNGEPLHLTNNPDAPDMGKHVFDRDEFEATLSKKTAFRLDDSGEFKRAKVDHYAHMHHGRVAGRYPAGGTMHDMRP